MRMVVTMTRRPTLKVAPQFAGLPLGERVVACAKLGGGTGIVLSLYAVLLLFVGGKGAAGGVPTWLLIPAYPAFGMIAGAIAGTLLPLGRSYVGAAAIGVVAAVLPVAAITAMVRDVAWSRGYVLPVIVLSVLLGGLTGLSWRAAHGRPRVARKGRRP